MTSEPLPPPGPGGGAWDDDASDDAALARLEDVLLGAPWDRALPDLDALLAAAGMSSEHLRRDERAVKVIREAILARPLASSDEVGHLRIQVELMTLEVEVLTARIADESTTAVALGRARERLADIRAELDQLRRQL